MSAAVVSSWFAVSESRNAKILEKSNQVRESALKRSAELAFEQGISHCKNGDIRLGLLWFAHSLDIAPRKNSELRYAIRANISTWARELPQLTSIHLHESPVIDVGIYETGKSVISVSKEGVVHISKIESGELIEQFQLRSKSSDEVELVSVRISNMGMTQSALGDLKQDYIVLHVSDNRLNLVGPEVSTGTYATRFWKGRHRSELNSEPVVENFGPELLNC